MYKSLILTFLQKKNAIKIITTPVTSKLKMINLLENLLTLVDKAHKNKIVGRNRVIKKFG